MSRLALFPYPFAQGALSLNCTLPGIEAERTPSGALLILEEIPQAASLGVHLRVQVPPGTIEGLLSAEELADPPCRPAVLLRSVPSRTRRLIDLTPDGADGFEATLQLPRRELHQAFTFTPVLLRTKPGSPAGAFASHAAALLADGDPVEVLLEERPMPPGGYLDIEFEDFRQSGNPLRRAYADSLVSIDVAGEFPKLWLNSGITSFRAIMDTRARRGAAARIRDAQYQAITAQVWTSLIFTSLGALASLMEDGIDGPASLDELVEWQKRVLYFWAPIIYPGLGNREQAIDELQRAAASGQGLAELHELAAPAIQQWSRAKAAFDGLFRFVTGDGI